MPTALREPYRAHHVFPFLGCWLETAFTQPPPFPRHRNAQEELGLVEMWQGSKLPLHPASQCALRNMDQYKLLMQATLFGLQ